MNEILNKKHKTLTLTAMVLSVFSVCLNISWLLITVIYIIDNNKEIPFNPSYIFYAGSAIGWIARVLLLSDLYLLSPYLTKSENMGYLAFFFWFFVSFITPILMLVFSVIFMKWSPAIFLTEKKTNLINELSTKKRLWIIISVLFTIALLFLLIMGFVDFSETWGVGMFINIPELIGNALFVMIFIISTKLKILVSKKTLNK